ncbi:uncharacterized protein LOC134289798 isoform X2 [Aedes albopictus]|uniref:Uncharacterized protein n=1 Tax=Aedes albopictus TaxID=7160 RepID=A0ABM1Z9Q1_AEDAL
MANEESELDHLQQSSASELNLSVDLVNLLNRYGIQFADAASVGSFLSQLGIVGTDQQILISAAEDALPGDQNSVEKSVLQCNNGESEEGNFSDANESAAETAFHPLGGDSSGIFIIVPSERELTALIEKYDTTCLTTLSSYHLHDTGNTTIIHPISSV